MTTLQERMDELTAPGEVYEKLDDGSVRCHACAHHCLIKPGRRGICQVRFNQNGELRVPWGYVAALQADPIEKKPFTHLMPGSDALTFGMLGCNFHCGYCQNWITSQALRDADANAYLSPSHLRRISPEQVVRAAQSTGSRVVVSSYNEPLITSEWALSIFKQAKAAGLLTACVSNGYAAPQALEYLRPYLDGYKIDLKSMDDKRYRSLGGVLNNVLNSIRLARELGLWVEVVTLVIPGFNDSKEELWDAARYLVSVSADIPWHLTAYHPDYKETGAQSTPSSTLQTAAEVGQEAGLRYVYAGNLPGQVGSLEDTFCPHCQERLIGRRGYTLTSYAITPEGKCPKCGLAIAGVWPQDPQTVNLRNWGFPRRVEF